MGIFKSQNWANPDIFWRAKIALTPLQACDPWFRWKGNLQTLFEPQVHRGIGCRDTGLQSPNGLKYFEPTYFLMIPANGQPFLSVLA